MLSIGEKDGERLLNTNFDSLLMMRLEQMPGLPMEIIIR
jgi:hypothetical protein